jgi:hypothetical protein
MIKKKKNKRPYINTFIDRLFLSRLFYDKKLMINDMTINLDEFVTLHLFRQVYDPINQITIIFREDDLKITIYKL